MKTDWNIWRAYRGDTGKTLMVGVAPVGKSGVSAFKGNLAGMAFERRATVYSCTKEQAEDVMNTLNPTAIGMPS